jgi:hypothetical protein
MRSAFRPRRVLVAGLATATLLGVSGVAFAVVQSVDSSPQPQVVIPASASVGTDEPLTHDARDDRNRGTEQRHGADDPATHDVRDDNGADDPATHDVGDDHGGSTSRHGGDDATPEPVRGADDHGGHGRDG